MRCMWHIHAYTIIHCISMDESNMLPDCCHYTILHPYALQFANIAVPKDPHAGEPFDHATTDAAGQEGAQRKAMVWGQQLPVLLESKQHISLSVKRPAQVNGSCIGTGLALRQFPQGTLKMNKAMFLGRPCDAHGCQQVTKPNSCPNRVAYSTCTPVKADSLLGHVLFFATVACTNEGNRNGNDGAPLSCAQTRTAVAQHRDCAPHAAKEG